MILSNEKGIESVQDKVSTVTSFRDFFGGRSGSYQEVMDEIQREAIAEISNEAESLGANAIIGFQLDFDNIGSKKKSLLMAFAKGTAVVLE